MDPQIDPGEFVQLDVGEKIFLCSLKTVRKYPNSTLANCIRNSSHFPSGTTITLERDPKYFQLILDYMRDDRLDKLHLLSYYETRQLCNEAKFFCLDKLVKLCQARIDSHPMNYGNICPQIVTSRTEFDELLTQARSTGEFTILMNLDMLDRDRILEMDNLGNRDELRLVTCHGKVTAYSSEFYEAGKLIKCGESVCDLLSYVYYMHTGVML
uniref:Potassium channel tetramerisation-type BTB domain-containing protein n=1 Tax=Aceria tosichella TaxID=561515 RepID=A0A6G1SAD0_9ACAR